MANNGIELDFDGFMVLEASLFDTPLAQRFAERLPYDDLIVIVYL